jgi:hypothetical protein
MSETRSIPVTHAGLAGALALAAGSGAYGGVVFVSTPANLPNAATPTAAGPVTWDVNGDAVNDFSFSFRNPQAASPANGVLWQANMNPTPAGGINAVIGYGGTSTFAYGTKLNSGDQVGPAAPTGSVWKNVGQVILGSFYRFNGVVTPYGGFASGATPSSSVVRGFVGFRFNVGGNTRYGWLDVEIRGSSGAANTGGIFFFGAAYEDSGQQITIPAPGSMAALALGAVACARRSRRRTA